MKEEKEKKRACSFLTLYRKCEETRTLETTLYKELHCALSGVRTRREKI